MAHAAYHTGPCSRHSFEDIADSRATPKMAQFILKTHLERQSKDASPDAPTNEFYGLSDVNGVC